MDAKCSNSRGPATYTSEMQLLCFLKTGIEVRMLGRRRSRLHKWSPTWTAETILSLYVANYSFTKALYLFGVFQDGFGKKSKVMKRWGQQKYKERQDKPGGQKPSSKLAHLTARFYRVEYLGRVGDRQPRSRFHHNRSLLPF